MATSSSASAASVFLLTALVVGLLAFGVSFYRQSPHTIPHASAPLHYEEVDQALFSSLAAAVGPGRAFWKLRSLPLTVASPVQAKEAYNDEELSQRKLVEDELRSHSIDHSYHEASMPEVVVYPTTTEHVAAVVALCHKHNVPITGKLSLPYLIIVLIINILFLAH
jgi:hypothetical protein